MIINICDEINNSLELNSYATEFIENLNSFKDDEFIIDFGGVIFISRAFAQSYFVAKRDSNKNISEINLSRKVKPMMDMVQKQIIKENSP